MTVPLVWALVAALLALTQSTVATKPQFDVASVKPCGEPVTGGRGGPGNARGAGGGGVPARSSGRLRITCGPGGTVAQFIRQAYLQFANGQRNPVFGRGGPIEGGPAWITSDLCEIDAIADPTVTQEMMRGPMLQSLLEDRFKLKLHHETREVPVYELTVAKNGPNLRQVEDGSCVPIDLTQPPRPTLISADGKISFPDGGDQRMSCGSVGIVATGVQAFGMSVNDFAKFLSSGMDRPVIDKTAISGHFDFRVDFDQASAQFLPPDFRRNASTSGAAPSDPSGLPSFFTAIQEQLRLKLEPARGPSEFLVIDHVERPSKN